MYRLNTHAFIDQDFNNDVGVVSLVVHTRLAQRVSTRGNGVSHKDPACH
jgi:hypothetical protein